MIVVTDLEGTVTAGETWRGLTQFLTLQGSGGAVRRMLLPYAIRRWLTRLGFRENPQDRLRLMADLARLMRGRSRDEWREAGEWIAEHILWPARFERIWQELADARRAGARVIVCSGAFQPVVDAFARRGDFEGLGTPLAWNGSHATGLGGPINQAEWKAAGLRNLLGDTPIDQAYGDTTADIPMLRLAASATVVDHDPELRREAQERGWRILSDREARSAA